MVHIDLSGMFSTTIYSLLGVFIFVLTLSIIELGTKYSIRKKIVEEGNIALAIVLGSIVISLGFIISAAIR